MSERTDRLRAALEQAAGRVVITGHDAPDVDSLAGCVLMRALADFWGIAAQIVTMTRADEQAMDVMAKFGFDAEGWRGEIDESDSLVLIDHHQPLHGGSVVAVIDHHPTACPPNAQYVQIEGSGASTLMVLNLMKEAGMQPDTKQRALAVTALYLDTIALRSAKIPPEEVVWGRQEARALGLDENWLEREGMGLEDMTRPAHELAMLGRKVYTFAGRRVLSTYVQTDAMTEELLAQILDILKEEIAREQAALWVFIVQDPAKGRTSEYDIAPDGTVREIAYDFLASRGKNVMPRVEREMMEGV